eukprot:UN00444
MKKFLKELKDTNITLDNHIIQVCIENSDNNLELFSEWMKYLPDGKNISPRLYSSIMELYFNNDLCLEILDQYDEVKEAIEFTPEELSPVIKAAGKVGETERLEELLDVLIDLNT